MKRSLKVALGIAAGTTLAVAAFSKKGRRVRSRLSGRFGEMANSYSENLEKKARRIHDSEISYG